MNTRRSGSIEFYRITNPYLVGSETVYHLERGNYLLLEFEPLCVINDYLREHLKMGDFVYNDHLRSTQSAQQYLEHIIGEQHGPVDID